MRDLAPLLVGKVVLDTGNAYERQGHSRNEQALIDAAIEWLRSRGAPRVVLWSVERNEAAQRLFARLGFRRTMVEMTREL